MSASNGNPGLSFGAMNNGIRPARVGNQGYPPPPSKPVLSQHAAPYQHYSHQPQQSNYPQLFTTPSQSPVHNNVQNGASRSQQQQPQAQLPVPSSRPRPPSHRQMPPQPNNPPINYLPATMGQQHLPQQPMNPQSMTQQPLNSQPMGQQAMGQQAMAQPQAMNQQQQQPPMNPQQMSQQAISQQALSQQAINHQQSMSQDSSMMSQPTPPSHPHAILTPQPPAQSQAQQPPQPPQPPPQQPQPIHPERPTQSHEAPPEDSMDVESPGESGDGEEGDAKNSENGTPFQPRAPMGNMMTAPPEGGSYPTLDAVHKAVLEYCTSVGYAIVIGKPPKRISPEMRKRKTSSRKCDCQFGFFAIEQRTQWTVRYRPDPIHLEHNHGPSESPMLHPAARKLDSKMVATVKELKDSGVGVTQTLEILQAENPNVPLMPRDIYNARAAINRNPTKVNAGLAEDRPAIYSKPRPTAEERIIADLRKEIAKVNEELLKEKEDSEKKIGELEEKLREKDKTIQKYEMFVDICNERVMFQREKLKGLDDNNDTGNSA